MPRGKRDDDFLAEDDDDAFSTFEENLASRLIGFDKISVQAAHEIAEPLEKLARYLGQEENSLSKLREGYLRLFSFEELLRAPWKNDIAAVRFLTDIFTVLTYTASTTANEYQVIAEQFSYYVKDKLPEPLGELQKLTSTQQKALKTTTELAYRSLKLYTAVKEDFQKILAEVYAETEQYYKRLRQKFLKSAQPDDPQMNEMMLLLQGMQGLAFSEKYVKIQLINKNPLLTDFLLDLAELVPAYEERMLKEKKDKKKVREISNFAVQRLADTVVGLANKDLLQYLEEPKLFFSELSTIANQFSDFFVNAEQHHQDIADIPHVRVLLSLQQREKLSRPSSEKISSLAYRLKNVDFKDFRQSEDDYLPNSRKEKEHFALREELLMHLYTTLQKISEMDAPEAQLKTAEQAVRKAASLKQQIEGLLITKTKRQLRKNKLEDNEYYIGKQGQIGMFYFERAPTPQVKIEEVIGESFKISKEHLAEVIESGVYPRVMSLSAPDGKVRSNILLIGPYGCGKTELARAVCADPRVIGANVSVRNILTAYMHESPNNIGRVYDAAKQLYIDSGETKPVVLVLDEFDGFFNTEKEFKTYGANDMQQIELVLSEMLDGMGDYNGITTMAMTNNPLAVPKRIVRRFRYTDVVGQLTEDERAGMLKMYLEKALPLHQDISSEHHQQWAKQLEDAPGDVVRKVADEVHFSFMRDFFSKFPQEAQKMERTLASWEQGEGTLDHQKARTFLKEKFAGHYRLITPDEVTSAIKNLLTQPSIVMQINKARKVYRDAEVLKEQLAEPEERSPFGLTSARKRELEE